MAQIISFSLNGESYYIKTKVTILDLICYLNYNDSLLVLEYNNLICNKKKWNQIYLQPDDKLEIVTIVGGG